MINPDIIPPITEKIGKHWPQPSSENILIDDDSAVMNKRDFSQLLNYETSQPTGAYEGKMWRSGMLLHWYGFHEDPKLVRCYTRRIILVD